MPLNRIHASKATLNWIRLLKEDRNVKLTYTPGLLLFPIKEAGPIFGYVDIAFWAEFLYVTGSIFYIVDSLYLINVVGLEADDDNPRSDGAILNIAACVIFIVNAAFCIFDWWLQYKQVSIAFLGFELSETSELVENQFSYKSSFYYFLNNLFFMGAAVIYLIQGIWWVDPSSDLLGCTESFYCGTFSINFWAAFLYVLSGGFAVVEYFEYKEQRKQQGLCPLQLFTSIFSENFDWFGWGDWFYLFSAVVELYQALDSTFIHDDDFEVGTFYSISQSLFLIDAIFYLTGYVMYCLELKNAFNSGKLSPEQFDEISKYLLPQEQQEELKQNRRSSLVNRVSQIESDFKNLGHGNTSSVIELESESIDISEATALISGVRNSLLARSSLVADSTTENPMTLRTQKSITSTVTKENSSQGSMLGMISMSSNGSISSTS